MLTRREFLSLGPLPVCTPKHSLADIVQRVNLIQQINKHDPISGRVYVADIYQYANQNYYLISGKLQGPIQDLKTAFIAAESDLSVLRYTDSDELAQELTRLRSPEHERLLNAVIESIYFLE